MSAFVFDATAVPKPKKKRLPTKPHHKQKSSTVGMSEYTLAVFKHYGNGNLSAGLKRAAVLLVKQNIFDRDDLAAVGERYADED